MRVRQRASRRGSVPIEITWSPLARARLHEIRAYVALENPGAAERLATRIAAVVEALRDYPYLGRPEPSRNSRVGYRRDALHRSYRVRGKRVTINTIWHGAQRKEA